MPTHQNLIAQLLVDFIWWIGSTVIYKSIDGPTKVDLWILLHHIPKLLDLSNISLEHTPGPDPQPTEEPPSFWGGGADAGLVVICVCDAPSKSHRNRNPAWKIFMVTFSCQSNCQQLPKKRERQCGDSQSFLVWWAWWSDSIIGIDQMVIYPSTLGRWHWAYVATCYSLKGAKLGEQSLSKLPSPGPIDKGTTVWTTGWHGISQTAQMPLGLELCANSAAVIISKPRNRGFCNVVLLLLDQAPPPMHATLLESLAKGLSVKSVFGHNLLHPRWEFSPSLVPPGLHTCLWCSSPCQLRIHVLLTAVRVFLFDITWAHGSFINKIKHGWLVLLSQ